MTYKKEVGDFGEKLARDFLQKNGYRVLEKNIKLSYNELDIVAMHNNKTVFVEVKTMFFDPMIAPEDNFGRRKIDSLKQAVIMYCRARHLSFQDVRMDLICITLDRKRKTGKIKHYKDVC